MTDQSIYEVLLFSVKCGSAFFVLLALAVIILRHESGVIVREDTGEYDD